MGIEEAKKIVSDYRDLQSIIKLAIIDSSKVLPHLGITSESMEHKMQLEGEFSIFEMKKIIQLAEYSPELFRGC